MSHQPQRYPPEPENSFTREERIAIYKEALGLYTARRLDEPAMQEFIGKSEYHRWCVLHLMGDLELIGLKEQARWPT